MADGFETELLKAVPISPNSTGWQQGTEGGQNPVDAAVHVFEHGVVVGADIMWPLVLASYARITVNQAKTLIAEAQAADPENWLTHLRSNWP